MSYPFYKVVRLLDDTHFVPAVIDIPGTPVYKIGEKTTSRYPLFGFQKLELAKDFAQFRCAVETKHIAVLYGTTEAEPFQIGTMTNYLFTNEQLTQFADIDYFWQHVREYGSFEPAIPFPFWEVSPLYYGCYDFTPVKVEADLWIETHKA